MSEVTLADALEAQRERLLPCVHCGFCLPACPTYSRLGDENDSPRGRLHLMRLVVEGRLEADSDAFRQHIDRCLGCRACEPVCPSGVEYGTLLELARETASRAAPPSTPSRLLLGVFASRPMRELFFLGGRALRATGLAALGARLLPDQGLLGSARLGLAMLASTVGWVPPPTPRSNESSSRASASVDAPQIAVTTPQIAATPPGSATAPTASSAGRVGVLIGCVQEGLYSRVNAATVRVLEANGFSVVPVAGQECCGALHAHGGALDEARALARVNVEAFERAGVDWIAVNAAGCGASMKEYGHMLEHDASWATRAERFSARVRDVVELLADAGPREGASVPCSVAYDHPCHLLHAQRIEAAPLSVLAAVPGVDVRIVERADECCGGAGIYGLTHPELGGNIGADKVRAVRACGSDAVATPNPGCMMQIGAGLRLQGAKEGVVHPVELLDESYRRAGYYSA